METSAGLPQSLDVENAELVRRSSLCIKLTFSQVPLLPFDQEKYALNASQSSRQYGRSLLYKSPAVVGIVSSITILMGLKFLSDPPSKPEPILFSREISCFTEPRLADGYIDYSVALNRQRQDDVQDADNAAGLLVELTEQHALSFTELDKILEADVNRCFPDAESEGYSLVGLRMELEERLQLRTWKAEDFPGLADFLKSNETALKELRRVSRKEGLFLPLKETANIAETSRSFRNCTYQGQACDLYGVMDTVDEWSRATIMAAMQNLEGKSMDLTLEDLKTILNLSELLQQQPDMSCFSRSVFLRRDVAKTVASIAVTISDHETLDQLAKFVSSMLETPVEPESCRGAVLTSRCMELSRIMALHSGDERTQAEIFVSNQGDIHEATRRNIHLRLNVNPILQAVNTQFDRIEEILSNPDLAWQRQQVMRESLPTKNGESSDIIKSRLSARNFAARQHPDDPWAVNQFIAYHVNLGFRDPWWTIPAVRSEALCWEMLANIAVALQRFKLRNDSYPAHLQEIRELLPAKLEDPFADSFGTGDFEYLLKENQQVFQLSSVGSDGVVDPTIHDGPHLESHTDNRFLKLPAQASR